MTNIEWTDATWNPITGCDRISPGCDHCYALTMAARLQRMGNPRYRNDGDPPTSGPGFGVTIHEDLFDRPTTWRKPRRVFVCSMADLFHPSVPASAHRQLFDVMASTPHTYQVLTKRPRRMLQFARTLMLSDMPWPANVWAGVSIEDQTRAWQRLPLLAEVPATVRWVSAEPLLESLAGVDLSGIDWVVAGGESGHGHRPVQVEWVRELRRECERLRIAFTFKQWGGATHNAGGSHARRVNPRRPTPTPPPTQPHKRRDLLSRRRHHDHRTNHRTNHRTASVEDHGVKRYPNLSPISMDDPVHKWELAPYILRESAEIALYDIVCTACGALGLVGVDFYRREKFRRPKFVLDKRCTGPVHQHGRPRPARRRDDGDTVTLPPAARTEVFAAIYRERDLQVTKWGGHDRYHSIGVWVTILGRQFGMLCAHAMSESTPSAHHSLQQASTATLHYLYERTTKLAAVAVTISEYVLEILEDREKPAEEQRLRASTFVSDSEVGGVMRLPADWFVTGNWGLVKAAMVIRSDDPMCDDNYRNWWFLGHEPNRLKAWQRARYYDPDLELRGMRTALVWMQGWCCNLANESARYHLVEHPDGLCTPQDFDFRIHSCTADDAEAVAYTHVWWVD